MYPEPQTTVISLHGIRTRGQWQKDLQAALEDGGFKHRALDFGFFRAASLINPWARERKVKWFLEQYTQIVATTRGHISIIAHSFGSYIVAVAMRKHPQIKFERIILCGSIVPVNYDWDSVVKKRNQAKEVLNQYGKQDIWVRIAEWAVPDAGPSGYKGFKNEANGAVIGQEFTDYSHSEYFFDLNFRDNWIPFLQGRGVRPQYNLTDEGANWKFRLLLALLALFAVVAGYLVYARWNTKEPAAADEAITQEESQSVAPDQQLDRKDSAEPPAPHVDEARAGDGAPAGTTTLPQPPQTIPTAPTWSEEVFEKIKGEWRASNTYPPFQPPAAAYCAVVRSYESRLSFNEANDDAIRGDYEMSEKQSVTAVIPDANAPSMCNQLLTGNPGVSELRIARKASVTLMALNGSASDLVLKSDFYECKLQGASNCPPNEIGTYPNIPIRVIGDFNRFIVNDMNFGR